MRAATMFLLVTACPGLAVAQDKPRVVLQRVISAEDKPAENIPPAQPGESPQLKSGEMDDAKPESVDIKPAVDAKLDKIQPPRVPEFSEIKRRSARCAGCRAARS